MNKKGIINLIFIAVGVGMGIATVVLNLITDLQTDTAITMLGIGLACLGLSLLPGSNLDTNPKK